MILRSVNDILEAARAAARPWRVAIAGAHEESTLSAVLRARRMGFIEPVLFGDRRRLESLAGAAGADLKDLGEIRHTENDFETVRQAADLVFKGDAQALVKGLVPTGALIRAVLHQVRGTRGDRLLSHVGVFDSPIGGRMMFITDAGINIAPNVHRKVRIVRNAVAVARALGIARPRVALLAAIDVLNYPSMPATLDAALVAKIAADGAIPDACVEGPFALDNAISEEAAAKKTRKGEVAGRADILCAPEIETANVLYKALQTFSGVTFASVVVGAGKPIAVPSRADSADTKLMSIALACLLSDADPALT